MSQLFWGVTSIIYSSFFLGTLMGQIKSVIHLINVQFHILVNGLPFFPQIFIIIMINNNIFSVAFPYICFI